MEKSIKVAIVGAFSALTAWLGVLAIPVYLLVACNIIDYLTGIMAALSRGEKISSEIGFRGIAKKVGQWLLVVIGWVVDVMIEYAGHAISPDFTVPIIVSICVASWLVFNEIISILENLKAVGVPLPGFLVKIVEFFKKKVEDIGDAAITETEGKDEESHRSVQP